MPLEGMSYPNRRNDRQSWHYFKILECCNYFMGQRGGAANKMAVTLITTNEQKSDQPDSFQPPLGVATSRGIFSSTLNSRCPKSQNIRAQGSPKGHF
jgi:hypothetical protein